MNIRDTRLAERSILSLSSTFVIFIKQKIQTFKGSYIICAFCT